MILGVSLRINNDDDFPDGSKKCLFVEKNSMTCMFFSLLGFLFETPRKSARSFQVAWQLFKNSPCRVPDISVL